MKNLPDDVPTAETVRRGKRHSWFDRAAGAVTHAVGTPLAFGIALVSILLWALSGPLFGYSETWQLVVNTATTIVTFLMVFVIQQSQNKDSLALHLTCRTAPAMAKKASASAAMALPSRSCTRPSIST